MLEVSFYILPSTALSERDLFTCKLVDKAYRQGVYSLILTTSEAHSKIMDDLLWTFRVNSFIPHQIAIQNKLILVQQILISADQTYLEQQGSILINLASQLPKQLSSFNRIIDILYQDENILQAGRDRYREYQIAGATITTHKL